MKKTRKWAFVAQEAKRLVGLGLPPAEIAARLDVNRSTVTRWLRAGKLLPGRATRSDEGTAPPRRPRTSNRAQAPAKWASQIRRSFALDPTDGQLLNLAVTALGLALDSTVPAPVRLQATARFQSLVRQLALVARHVAAPGATAAAATAASKSRRVPPRRTSAEDPDPRQIFTVVK